MGVFSIWHWAILLIWCVLVLVPVSRILKQAGYSPALAVLGLIPIVNLIALFVFAFSKWPNTR